MTDAIEKIRTETMVAWPMVMLRISLGIMFVIAGYGKAARGAGFGDALALYFSDAGSTLGLDGVLARRRA